MKVVALKPGYLGKLRQPGDEFDVPEGSKASWFVPVVDGGPEVEPPEVEPQARAPKGAARGRRAVEDLV
jgi:hypothetical protein